MKYFVTWSYEGTELYSHLYNFKYYINDADDFNDLSVEDKERFLSIHTDIVLYLLDNFNMNKYERAKHAMKLTCNILNIQEMQLVNNYPKEASNYISEKIINDLDNSVSEIDTLSDQDSELFHSFTT